jgi:acyl-CoA dehydrogenase
MARLDFSLSEGHQMVLETAQDVLRKLEPKRKEHLRQIYEERQFPEAVWRAIGDAGIMGTPVPERYGGTNMGLLGMTLALEAFGSCGLANAFCVLNTMAAMPLLHAGSDEQKLRFLTGIADGSLRFAFAITEPDTGTNSSAIRTLARWDSQAYRLSGSKGWVTGADLADYILIVARTIPLENLRTEGLSETHGMGLFIVDTDAAGLEMQAVETTGIDGFRQFMLQLDDVEVPLKQRLGPKHRGVELIFDALTPERVLAAAQAIGVSEMALDKAIEYSRERTVFGDRPIGAYQAVQHPLARAKTEQESARLLCYKAAWLFDSGAPATEVEHYANMAKLKASEMVVEAVDAAIQTHGGAGFVRGHHLVSLWGRARLFKTAPINNEMVLNELAEHMLGLPRSY